MSPKEREEEKVNSEIKEIKQQLSGCTKELGKLQDRVVNHFNDISYTEARDIKKKAAKLERERRSLVRKLENRQQKAIGF